MVAWWWIPVSWGLLVVGVAIFFFLLNIGTFFRYLKISAM
jgi:hypothetical protein